MSPKKVYLQLSTRIFRAISSPTCALPLSRTSSSVVENKSKGGKKPWADVLVITCHTCQGVKRYPVQAARQKRRPVREKEARETTEKNTDAMDTVKEDG
ncbi:hypothetical protein F4780DRAFT_780013 [Xylariomycetidae sp. FL0641]|nr:hypothetical protein F4780DRAFT_780013 [Xylariomycetidae sp. FL0641]